MYGPITQETTMEHASNDDDPDDDSGEEVTWGSEDEE
jgi:hypothetical protein